MTQRAGRPRLALEAGSPGRVIGQLGRENLDRDHPPQPGVARAIHLSHAALSSGRENLVTAELRSWRQRHWIGSILLFFAPPYCGKAARNGRNCAAVRLRTLRL